MCSSRVMIQEPRIGRASASLIETCKLNSVDPQSYLTSTLNAAVKLMDNRSYFLSEVQREQQ